MNYHPCLF